MANGFASNALDVEHGYRPAQGRPGAALTPVMLAAAEMAETPPSGTDMLAAVAVGYEVGVRSGMYWNRDHARVYTSGLWGAIGAVAAAGGGFTLHSDRGWHYRTPDWVRACGEAGVERSMSRKGHSPDNAACEGFFGRLKVEFFHGRDWRGVSAERFAAEFAEWIRWYREGRLKAFDEGGRKVYDTIAGRRRRLGLAA